MNRGRPKSFDDNDALERAMKVFWKSGYEATSLDDLLTEMSIPRQSLYRSFGNKRTLFLKALDLYGHRMNTAVSGILCVDESASSNIDNLFKFWIDRLSMPDGDGCMMQNTCGQSVPIDKEITALVLKHQSQITEYLEQELIRGQNEGDINRSINTGSVARTITASVNGLFSLSRVEVRPKMCREVLETLRTLIQTN